MKFNILRNLNKKSLMINIGMSSLIPALFALITYLSQDQIENLKVFELALGKT